MKKLLAGILAGVAALAMPLAATARSAPAHAVSHVTIHAAATSHNRSQFRPMYGGVQSHVSRSAALAQAAAGTTIPMFTASQKDGTKTFTYSMVGNSPFVTEANPATTVKTFIINTKVKVKWDGDVYDPGASDPCDPAGTSPLARVKASPLFKNHTWKFGGTSVGSTQYADAFQRAEFYKYTGPTAINPDYHVTMSKIGSGDVLKATVTVSGFPEEDSGSCGDLLVLDVDTWDTQVIQNGLMPQLAQQGVTTATYPIFIVHDVVFSDSQGNCCILGYHNAFGSPTQVYSVADYDTSGAFSNAVADISDLSHEVGETWNDPLTNNPTKPWSGGQVGAGSCQSNLEVGDPLSGTNIPVTMGTFTYHPQEMAFFSWFYHQSPSIGINGWYSNNGTLTTPAAHCS